MLHFSMVSPQLALSSLAHFYYFRPLLRRWCIFLLFLLFTFRYQIFSQKSDFVFSIPWWLTCPSYVAFSCSDVGMTRFVFFISTCIYCMCMLSDLLNVSSPAQSLYGLSPASFSSHFPSFRLLLTFFISGLFLVAFFKPGY